jgi:leucyl aminopeptidase
MSRNALLATVNDLGEFSSVAIPVRFDGDFARVSPLVPSTIGELTIPRALEVPWCSQQGLTSAIGSFAVVRSFGHCNVTFISTGKGTISLDDWRLIAAAAVKGAGKTSVAVLLDIDDITNFRSVAQSLGEGALLSSYRYKTADAIDTVFAVVPLSSTLPPVAVHDDLEVGLRDGVVIGDAVNWAKYLIDTPAGYLPPKEFAKIAQSRLESDAHVRVNVWNEGKIKDERLGGLLGVSQGSEEPPRLIYATYDPRPKDKLPHVVLVGKGVTFDSGGLSLKSGEGMMTMKTDMTGAAVVLSVLSGASRLNIPVKVTAITPVTENLPSGTATKPGDVLTIRNGMTIEVLNTDAEGRLILADGLSLAAETKPDAIIDVATLTGAQAVALGDEIGALFSTSDDLAEELLKASGESGEAFCRLPLFDSYESHIESDVADMKNIGKPGKAGSIAAALILRRFVGEENWAHLDIAGPGRSDAAKGYRTKGATAFGARTILSYLTDLASSAIVD